MKNDLGLYPYKKSNRIIAFRWSKAQTETICKLGSNKFGKRRHLFSDEKMFDIDGVYNTQNDRVWPVDRADAVAFSGDENSHKKQWFGLVVSHPS